MSETIKRMRNENSYKGGERSQIILSSYTACKHM